MPAAPLELCIELFMIFVFFVIINIKETELYLNSFSLMILLLLWDICKANLEFDIWLFEIILLLE
jgi:hypothetical protein